MLIGGLPGEIVAKESRLPRSGLVQRELSQVKTADWPQAAAPAARKRRPEGWPPGKGGRLPRAEAAYPTAPYGSDLFFGPVRSKPGQHPNLPPLGWRFLRGQACSPHHRPYLPLRTLTDEWRPVPIGAEPRVSVLARARDGRQHLVAPRKKPAGPASS